VEIEWCPRRQKCQVCGEEFSVADFEMACPKCGDGPSTCISGTELDIAYLELEAMREAVEKKVLSETEGEDKPLKYPGIFHRSALMILTKIDLLPHVEFSAELALENARKIHPEIDTIALSARTGEGLDLWMAWLGALQQKVQHQAAAAIT
jgi:Hydrogenase/urease nickel incorporation, metallochaperone, hypA/CobW/HypB/UreG, nucleotide-binding domain